MKTISVYQGMKSAETSRDLYQTLLEGTMPILIVAAGDLQIQE